MEHPMLSEHETVRQRWRRDFRSWGKRRFAFWFGAIGFGGLMFVAMTAFNTLDHHRIDYVFVALNLVLWPLAGYRFGCSMWRRYYGPDTIGK